MKIPKALQFSQLAGVDTDATKQAMLKKAQNASQPSIKEESQAEVHNQSSDKVSLGLARVLRNELNVEALAEERANKVAKLKELIQSGRYQIDSEKVARSFLQETSFEIDAEKAGRQ